MYYETRNLLCLLGKEWAADYLYYVEKVARLGFDLLKSVLHHYRNIAQIRLKHSAIVPLRTEFS